MSDPTTVATAWMDRAWDDDAGLLWNGPGAFDDVTDAPRTVHLVRETAWYAIGLLRRGQPGDAARAARAIEAVCDHQYDAPGAAVARHVRPVPRVAAAHRRGGRVGRLRPELAAVRRHRAGRRGDRLPASRPARAAGPRGHRAGGGRRAGRPGAADLRQHRPAASLARRLVGPPGPRATRRPSSTSSDATGASSSTTPPPTTASTCWRSGCGNGRTRPSSCSAGAPSIEAALWTDIARWWHAGLGNLCGPYSRAYGMDLHSYVSGLALALWCAGLPAPAPRPGRSTRCPTATTSAWRRCCSTSGSVHPSRLVPPSTASPGPHTVEQVVQDDPPPSGHRLARPRPHGRRREQRRAAAGPGPVPPRHDPLAAPRRSGRLAAPASTTARPAPTASEARLDVECEPHPRRGPAELRWESNVARHRGAGGPLVVPGPRGVGHH